MTIDDLLRQGIAALNAERKEEARNLLAQVVQQDQYNEMGWLWLSGAVDTNEERRICLENVLAINPNNTVARRGVEQLIASKREAGKERSSNVLCYPLSDIRLTPNQFQLYERAQFLHREAKQNYVVAVSKLRTPVSPGYRKSWGPQADSEWLEKLQEVASELYDRIVSLRSIKQRVFANGQELETLVPKSIGVRARRIQEMTTEVQEWASELHVQLGETLRLADEWQLKADQWEMELMTEDPDEREVRWMKEEIAIEAASYDGQDLYEWGVWE